MVKKDGQVSNVKSLCDIGSTCCKEAVREVKAMPKWKQVRVQFNQLINFKL